MRWPDRGLPAARPRRGIAARLWAERRRDADRRPRRTLARLAVLTAGVSAALTLAAPPSSANTVAFDLGAAPADFARVMGYSPQVGWLADGTQRMINPTGACSVPGDGRPFDFAVACKAHDFGYDLLRYAQRKGQPLPAQARAEIDRRLTDDLHTQCRADTSATTCDATVAVFAAAVGFNSWRQLSGPPIDQSGMTRTVGLSLLALVGLGVGLRKRIRPPSGRRADSAGRAG